MCDVFLLTQISLKSAGQKVYIINTSKVFEIFILFQFCGNFEIYQIIAF